MSTVANEMDTGSTDRARLRASGRATWWRGAVLALGVATAGLVWSAGQMAAAAGRGDRQQAINTLVDEVFVPAYQALASEVEELSAAVDDLCAELGSTEALVVVQEAWGDARSSWVSTRPFRFGPAVDQRAMSDIDFEVDVAKVDALLAGSEPVDAEAVAGLGADVRGLGAIEHVLFAPDGVDARGCEFASSASVAVGVRAERVLAGWLEADGDVPAFADQLRTPGIDGGMYATVNDVYNDVINHMIFALTDVADSRIGRASGDITGSPRYDEVDAGRAESALVDATSILEATGVVWSVGLRDVVAGVSPDAAERIDGQFAAAESALAAIPGPIADTIDTAPLTAGYEAVSLVRTSVRTEAASLLGITLTFGDADGDS